MAELNGNTSSNYVFRIINTKVPIYYEFPRNPSKLSYKIQKVYNETRTIGGFVFEHWGKKPTTLQVEGKVLKNPNYLEDGFVDVMLPTDLLRLKQCFELDQRKIQNIVSKMKFAPTSVNEFLNGLSDTIIQYKLDIYSGFFTEFEYTEDSENPYYNYYRFQFFITSSLEDLIRDSLLNLTGVYGIVGQSIIGIGSSRIA